MFAGLYVLGEGLPSCEECLKLLEEGWPENLTIDTSDGGGTEEKHE